jgi:hypothetical protein
MIVTKDFLLSALLKENYLPNQKRKKEELPPVFTTSRLNYEIANEIKQISLNNIRKKAGFDFIQYRATRFNNVPRIFSIPHIKPYIDTCFEIYNDWGNLKHICSNVNSIICPRAHSDGRIIIMDYESDSKKRNRFYTAAFGKKEDMGSGLHI